MEEKNVSSFPKIIITLRLSRDCEKTKEEKK